LKLLADEHFPAEIAKPSGGKYRTLTSKAFTKPIPLGCSISGGIRQNDWRAVIRALVAYLKAHGDEDRGCREEWL
jgi:hypothetical protein